MTEENIKYPKTPEGDTDRIKLAVRRCRQVLQTKVAQRADAPMLGMQIRIVLIIDTKTRQQVDELKFDPIELPDEELLAFAANKARPFVLDNDEIQFHKVKKSLMRCTNDERQQRMVKQIARMWDDAPFKRWKFFKSVAGEAVLPEGNGPEVVTNSVLAQKYFYSEIGHSHDASNVLNHIESPDQLQAFACLVGDWIAIAAHTEAAIHEIRPDLCPGLTDWAGDPMTIFERINGKKPPRANESAESTE